MQERQGKKPSARLLTVTISAAAATKLMEDQNYSELNL
jgi:hypothetical protein